MKANRLSIPDVLRIEPKVFCDDRGFFFESFSQAQFEQAIGRRVTSVQGNHSCIAKNVLRGLHHQIQQPKGKLLRVVQGEMFVVAVDLLKSIPTFGHWVGEVLSAQNKLQLWVPEGFAHVFVVLNDTAEFFCKTTDYSAPAYERRIDWNDPTIGLQWPAGVAPILSAKDAQGQAFAQAEVFS